MAHSIDKQQYDQCRKEVCDERGNHKPNHCSTTIICLLENVLEEIKKLKECNCCKCASLSKECSTVEDAVATTIDNDQAGLINVNISDVKNKVEKVGKKK